MLSLTMIPSIAFAEEFDNLTTKTAETTQNEEFVINGEACVNDRNAATTIDYIMEKYPIDTIFKESGACWGYAEAASNLLTGSSETKFYSNLKFNKTNFRNKCLNAKAGTHLRLSKKAKFDGGYGHSIVLFKVTENLMIWGDCNRIGNNKITYYYGSLDSFMQYYDHYSYINMVKKTKI